MIVRRLVLVEGVGGKVEDTIVGTLVLQNLPVGGSLAYRLLTHAALHKHLVVEVALVYLPHIHEAEHDDGTDSPLRLNLLIAQQKQNGCADSHYEEGAPAVGGEDGDAHVAQIADKRIQIFCRNLTHLLHFGSRDIVREEHRGHDGEEQSHAGCGYEACPYEGHVGGVP